jgi:hypothetical protein
MKGWRTGLRPASQSRRVGGAQACGPNLRGRPRGVIQVAGGSGRTRIATLLQTRPAPDGFGPPRGSVIACAVTAPRHTRASRKRSRRSRRRSRLPRLVMHGTINVKTFIESARAALVMANITSYGMPVRARFLVCRDTSARAFAPRRRGGANRTRTCTIQTDSPRGCRFRQPPPCVSLGAVESDERAALNSRRPWRSSKRAAVRVVRCAARGHTARSGRKVRAARRDTMWRGAVMTSTTRGAPLIGTVRVRSARYLARPGITPGDDDRAAAGYVETPSPCDRPVTSDTRATRRSLSGQLGSRDSMYACERVCETAWRRSKPTRTPSPRSPEPRAPGQPRAPGEPSRPRTHEPRILSRAPGPYYHESRSSTVEHEHRVRRDHVPPAPRSADRPLFRWNGVSVRFPPTFIPATPASQPRLNDLAGAENGT